MTLAMSTCPLCLKENQKKHILLVFVTGMVAKLLASPCDTSILFRQASLSMAHRSKPNRKRYYYLTAVLLLFVAAMAHRMVYLGNFPPPLATADEYHYFWAGMSMLDGEPPRSWSHLDVDEGSILGSFPFGGVMCPVVQPAFDHPPLFSFLAGITGKVMGAKPVEVPLQGPDGTTILWDVWFGKLRLLPVALFGVSFWLLWFMGRLLIGRSAALLGLTFFGGLGYFALHQRLVVPDSLLAPLAMGAFLTLELWRRNRLSSRQTGAIVITLLMLSTLTKIVGISLAAGIIAWGTIALRSNRPATRRLWIWSLSGALLGVAGVLFFAWLWGFDYFLHTTQAQSERFTSLDGFFEIISQQGLLSNAGFEPWLISGWIICFLAAVKGPRRFQPIIFGYAGIAAAYTFFGGERLFGWYFMTFYPVLALGWGWAIKAAWKKPDSRLALIILLLLLGSCSTAWMQEYETTRIWGRYIYVILTILVLLPWPEPGKSLLRTRLARGTLVILLLIGFSGEISRQIKLEIAYRKQHKENPVEALPTL